MVVIKIQILKRKHEKVKLSSAALGFGQELEAAASPKSLPSMLGPAKADS